MSETEAVLRGYLRRTLGVDEDAWTLRRSTVSGRGVFATRDLAPGDLIFHDRPVVWGPRAKLSGPMCASCHRVGRVSGCPGGCRLPVCSQQCVDSPLHAPQCHLLRQALTIPQDVWRLDLVGTIAPLRCLALSAEDREVVQCLQGNPGNIHGIEVDLLKKMMKDNLKAEDEEWMRHCCLAMDTNAFEFLRVLPDGSQVSLRGLYPLAAILNHACSPSTCHHYDKDGIMKVFAARPIAAGEEITTSYCSLLWSTAFRRMNLARTKHFSCRCLRCADPTEFGTMLSCLACTDKACSGLLLPVRPLRDASPWLCGSCGLEVSAKQAAQQQVAQGSVLQVFESEGPALIAEYLSRQPLPLPPQGQFIVQLKTSLVWQLGHHSGFAWQELSQEMLNLKEKCCRDLLEVLNGLQCGHCRTKGLVLLELHCTMCEQLKRSKTSGASIDKHFEEELSATLNIATTILQDDACAEKELNLRIQDQRELMCC